MNLQTFNYLQGQLQLFAAHNGSYTLTPAQYKFINDIYMATGETEPLGCGITKLWWTGEKDPFLWPGCWHDTHYPMTDGYVYHALPKKDVDIEFLKYCIDVAARHDDGGEIGRAIVYYKLVREFKSAPWVISPEVNARRDVYEDMAGQKASTRDLLAPGAVVR